MYEIQMVNSHRGQKNKKAKRACFTKYYGNRHCSATSKPVFHYNACQILPMPVATFTLLVARSSTCTPSHSAKSSTTLRPLSPPRNHPRHFSNVTSQTSPPKTSPYDPPPHHPPKSTTSTGTTSPSSYPLPSLLYPSAHRS